MGVTRFTNCILALSDGTFKRQDLYINPTTGRIISGQSHFYANRDPSSLAYNPIDRVIDLGGNILAPGFIDSQINGAYGVDFSEYEPESTTTLTALSDGNGSGDEDENQKRYWEGLDLVSRKIVETGTTSYVPTIITQKKHLYKLVRLLPLLRPRSVSGGAHVLGYHAEGPFLYPSKKGAHQESNLQTAPNGIKSFYDLYSEKALRTQKGVKVLTVAPDVEGVMESIQELTQTCGITVSIGHSEATVEVATQAIELGASWVTHLFNAMPQLHHRNPGVIGTLGIGSTPSQTAAKRPYYGLIADGIHVHPNAVKLAYEAWRDGCILVTDAMSWMNPRLKDGKYNWRKGRYIVKEGLKLKIDGTDTLAGSAISMDHCVRNLSEFTSVTLAESIKCATFNVAQMLGGETKARKGSLEVGKDADLVILGKEDGKVLSTWVMGVEVFNSQGKDLRVGC